MRVACVIPTHARAEFLEESLSSVISQTRPPAEVLVVSDVDDPATKRVVERLAIETDIDVRLLGPVPERRGASASRNRGIKEAQSDVVAFLDDDDVWKPDYLESALDVMERGGSAMVVTWFDEFGIGGEKRGPRLQTGLRAQDVIAINPGVTGSNIVVARAALEQVGGFDDRLRVKNDTDLFYRFLYSGQSYSVVQSVRVLQRKHQSGQLTGKSPARAEGTRAYIRKHYAQLTAEDLRLLRLHVERLYALSGASLPTRLLHTLGMFRYYRTADYQRLLRRGRDRSFAEVKALESSN